MNAKARIMEVVNAMPDDATLDDIFRELRFLRMVERGLDDDRAGRTVSNEEVRRRIKSLSRQ